MGRVWIRVYTLPADPTQSHSFYVGNAGMGGLSEWLASYVISENTTFIELREMIEFTEDNGMFRRSMFFTELSNIMEQCSNPHGYKCKDLKEYAFATMKGVGGDEKSERLELDRAPAIISRDVEEEPICEVIANLLQLDLILVPISQMCPIDNAITNNILGEIDCSHPH
mmetsp:Transcript_34002/g.49887  ORF Transcript_34002/g.49887 Transcript_34002/m.49887 type:complete len:169 (+) Transcript_34002:1184-1690(+)